MYNTTQAPASITLTVTSEQYNIFVAAINEAKAKDLALSDWTGESVADIEARYQLPPNSILDDMADAFFAQQSGIPMF